MSRAADLQTSVEVPCTMSSSTASGAFAQHPLRTGGERNEIARRRLGSSHRRWADGTIAGTDIPARMKNLRCIAEKKARKSGL